MEVILLDALSPLMAAIATVAAIDLQGSQIAILGIGSARLGAGQHIPDQMPGPALPFPGTAAYTDDLHLWPVVWNGNRLRLLAA